MGDSGFKGSRSHCCAKRREQLVRFGFLDGIEIRQVHEGPFEDLTERFDSCCLYVVSFLLGVHLIGHRLQQLERAIRFSLKRGNLAVLLEVGEVGHAG